MAIYSLKTTLFTPTVLFSEPKVLSVNFVILQVCSQRSNVSRKDFARALSTGRPCPRPSKWKMKEQTRNTCHPPPDLEKGQDFSSIQCLVSLWTVCVTGTHYRCPSVSLQAQDDMTLTAEERRLLNTIVTAHRKSMVPVGEISALVCIHYWQEITCNECY